MRVPAKRLGDDAFQLRFDRLDRLPGGQASSVRNAEDVRIDRECFLSERGVEHDIGGLAPDPGQRLEFFACARDLAVVVADQRLGQSDDILRLGVEQADRLDRLAQALLAERDHLLGRMDAREQRPSSDIDTGIGSLRGQHDGDQQLVGIAGFKLGRWCRVGLGQPVEEFKNLVALQALPSSPAITSRIV